MRIPTNFLLSTAFLAAIASFAFGQGLGYPEPPHHSVSRAARYWFDDGYIARAYTGRVGFMASSGCDHKPICSLCDYSRPRVCGCAHRVDLLTYLSGWLGGGSCGKSYACNSHPKVATQKHVTQKKVATQKWAKPKCAIQKPAVQKLVRPKCVTQKCPQQKCAPQKCAPQKCAPQKCAPQKCAPQKCAPQKCAVQKCPTQKCTKSCVSRPKCLSGCGPGLLDSVAEHIASLDLFRPRCGCKAKCGSCRPTLARPKSKSKSGGDDVPSTLPVPDPMDEGDAPPEVDPSVPPDPFLDGAEDVGTGSRGARPLQSSPRRWRRARTPRSVTPRLLPADSSARDVSRISYEELTDPTAPRKLRISQANECLDVFQAALRLENGDAQALPKLKSVPIGDAHVNPLRK